MDNKKIYPRLVILSCLDPNTRKPLFQRSDEDALNTKAGKALERLAQVGIRLSGLSEEALKDDTKDSSPKTQNTDSTSN